MKYLIVGIHGDPSCNVVNGMMEVWCNQNNHRYEYNYLPSLSPEWQSMLMEVTQREDPSYRGGFEPEDNWELAGTFTDSDTPRMDFAEISNFRIVPQCFTIEDGNWEYVGSMGEIIDLCGA